MFFVLGPTCSPAGLVFSTSTTMVPLPKTRGGVLEETIKAQIHLDFVANPNLTCEDIINLPNRDYRSQNAKAVRNRHTYLKNLKTKDQQHFWLLYSQAHKSALSSPYRDTVEVESDEEEAPSTPLREPRRKNHPRSSNSKKNDMSAPRGKLSSPAGSAFAYNTMFDTLDEAEAAGMYALIALVVRLWCLLTHGPFCLHSRRCLRPRL
jgi:hypothetical protein